MWRELLEAQVQKRGLGPVAQDLGYSKTAVSQVLSGKYPADSSRIEDAVLVAFSRVQCPFEGKELAMSACSDWCQRSVPSSSAWALRHWSACKTCPHNLSQEDPS